MLEELNPESEFYQLLPSYKGYISSDFLQATTPRQAAESFCFLYTRADCTPENLNLRCNLAQKIYNTYN